MLIRVVSSSGNLLICSRSLDYSLSPFTQNFLPGYIWQSSARHFPADQAEHLTQGIVVGEAGLVFCDLAELTVQALNNIRRVYDFPILD